MVRLILVNVGVFLLVATLGLLETLGIPLPNPGGAFGLATSSDAAVLVRRPWSIVTHMFVHLGCVAFGDEPVGSVVDGWNVPQLLRRPQNAEYLFDGGIGRLACLLFAAQSRARIWRRGLCFGCLCSGDGFDGGHRGVCAGLHHSHVSHWAGEAQVGGVGLCLLDYAALSRGANVGGHLGHLGGAAYGLLYMQGMKGGRDFGAPLERLLDVLATWWPWNAVGEKARPRKAKRQKRKRGKGLQTVHRSVTKEGTTRRGSIR